MRKLKLAARIFALPLDLNFGGNCVSLGAGLQTPAKPPRPWGAAPDPAKGISSLWNPMMEGDKYDILKLPQS